MVKKLLEAKATGEDSESIDPVEGEGGPVQPRRGDLKLQVNPLPDEIEDDVVTPMGDNDEGLHEAINALFGETELSESFKAKAKIVFEAAVIEKVNALVEEKVAVKLADLEEQARIDLDEGLETTADQINQYMDYVAENWINKNEIALEAGYKVTMAESLFSGLVKLIKEHNFNVDEDAKDTLAIAEEHNRELQERLDNTLNELLELKEENLNNKKDKIFETVSEGLVSTDVDRFKVLAESIKYVDLDQYEQKISVIKEHYFGGKPVTKPSREMLEEEYDTIPETRSKIDSTISKYAESISKMTKK